MLKSIAKITLLSLAFALPQQAQAQISDLQITEASSAILGAGTVAAQVRHLHQVPSVGIFSLSGSAASPLSHLGDEISTLEIYAERNAAGVSQLRHALSANPVTRHTMSEHNVDVRRVIGVSIGATGSMRFFIE